LISERKNMQVIKTAMIAIEIKSDEYIMMWIC